MKHIAFILFLLLQLTAYAGAKHTLPGFRKTLALNSTTVTYHKQSVLFKHHRHTIALPKQGCEHYRSKAITGAVLLGVGGSVLLTGSIMVGLGNKKMYNEDWSKGEYKWFIVCVAGIPVVVAGSIVVLVGLPLFVTGYTSVRKYCGGRLHAVNLRLIQQGNTAGVALRF